MAYRIVLRRMGRKGFVGLAAGTILVVVAVLLFSYLGRCGASRDALPTVPLPDVEGVWADSVFSEMTAEEKILQLLMEAVPVRELQASALFSGEGAGNLLVEHDSLRFYAELTKRYPDTLIPPVAFGSPIGTPIGLPMMLPLAHLLQVGCDSLITRYLIHYLDQHSGCGLNAVLYPLWIDRLHTVSLPDTLLLIRQAKWLNQFVDLALERGVIPVFELPKALMEDGAPDRLSDTLLEPFWARLISPSLPALRVSDEAIGEAQEISLREMIMARFGFHGLLFTSGIANSAERIVQNLMAGADFSTVGAITPPDLKKLVQRYQRERPFSNAVDLAVWRILLYKEWLLHHDGHHVDITEDHFSRARLMEFHLALNRAAVVRLHDSAELLPLRDRSVQNLMVLHLPAGTNQEELTGTLRYFVNFTTRRYAEGRPLVPGQGATNVVVLHGDHWPDEESLSAVMKLPGTVVVHAGNVEQLALLGQQSVVLHLPDSEAPRIWSQVANILYGGLVAGGVVPYDLSPELKGGMGQPVAPVIRLNYTIPEALGWPSAMFRNVDSIIGEAIRNGAFPGCQVFVAKGGHVVWHRSYGETDYTSGDPVNWQHLYDVASVTKVAATTLAMMKMTEEGKMHLDHPLGRYFRRIPAPGITLFADTLAMMAPARNHVFNIPLRHLLTHRSGLPAALPIQPFLTTGTRAGGRSRFIEMYSTTRVHDSADVSVARNLYMYRHYLDTLWARTVAMVPDRQPGYRYSDANMVLLHMAIDSTNGIPFDRYLEMSFYAPLGLRHSAFNPLDRFSDQQVVPTAMDLRWRRQLVHGTVHDPTAALLGGVAGNAGLFSNANDLGIIGQMLLNGGAYGGVRLLDAETIAQFATRQGGGRRGLGFDMPASDSRQIASSASPNTFGHLGFTGTCFWVDPDHEIVFVFLSNRIHPNVENRKINFFRVREQVHQAVYEVMFAAEHSRGVKDHREPDSQP